MLLRPSSRRPNPNSNPNPDPNPDVLQILAVAVVVSAVWHGHTRAADRLGLLFFVNINQACNPM